MCCILQVLQHFKENFPLSTKSIFFLITQYIELCKKKKSNLFKNTWQYKSLLFSLALRKFNIMFW